MKLISVAHMNSNLVQTEMAELHIRSKRVIREHYVISIGSLHFKYYHETISVGVNQIITFNDIILF